MSMSGRVLVSVAVAAQLAACSATDPTAVVSADPTSTSRLASAPIERSSSGAAPRSQPGTSTSATPAASLTDTKPVTTQSIAVTSTASVPLPDAPPTRFVEPGRGHQISTVLFDHGILPLRAGTIELVARSWGVVSAPSDRPGPFPLVVVLHGAHSFCSPPDTPRLWPCARGPEERNQDGLSYLTEALARSGFAAVALGINAEYATPTALPGEVAAALIERDVIGLLRSGAALGQLNVSTIDSSSAILIGHSRGASIAGVLGLTGDARHLSIPVAATVMIAPTTDGIDPNQIADVPTAVLIGSCDGDTGVDGGGYLTTTNATLRRSPIALILVDRATHNATNSLLGPDAVVEGRPGCDEPLDAHSQRADMEKLLPETVRRLVGLNTSGSVGNSLLDSQRADDRVGPGVRIVHIDPARMVTPVLNPESWKPAAAITQSLNGVICTGGSFAASASAAALCHRIDLADLVGRPASIHLAWTGSDGASLRILTPPSTPGTVLVIRAFADPLANPNRGSVGLVVSGQADATSAPTWVRNIDIDIAPVGAPMTGAGIRRGTVLWSERRFVIPDSSRMIQIRMVSDSAGSIDLVGVELVAPTGPPAR